MILETKYLRLHEYFVKTGRPIMTSLELSKLSKDQIEKMYAEAALFFQTNRKTISQNACVICGFEGQVLTGDHWLCLKHCYGTEEIMNMIKGYEYLTEAGKDMFVMVKSLVDNLKETAIVDGICLLCKKDTIMGQSHASDCSIINLNQVEFLIQRSPFLEAP